MPSASLRAYQARHEEALRLLNADRLQVTGEIRRIGEELAEIHQKLGSKADNQVQELQERPPHSPTQARLLGKLSWAVTPPRRTTSRPAPLAEIKKQVSEIVESEAAAELAQRL
jgi:hypothetical protein